MKTPRKSIAETTAQSPVIPTLVETSKEGLYLVAYCPVCDKSEKSKVEFPGQPREAAASVLKIRAHWNQRHGRNPTARPKVASKRAIS
jgi:hypothetical protein